MATKINYDTSIGSEERSVESATKFWGIVFAVILGIGVVMIAMFFMSDSGSDQRFGGTTSQERAQPGP
ncbi:MAG TPA: hypothetical protein VFZ49_00240 [Pyrinomonadaceae bacterium]